VLAVVEERYGEDEQRVDLEPAFGCPSFVLGNILNTAVHKLDNIFRVSRFGIRVPGGIAPVVTQVDGLGEVLHGDHGVLRHVLVHHLSPDRGGERELEE